MGCWFVLGVLCVVGVVSWGGKLAVLCVGYGYGCELVLGFWGAVGVVSWRGGFRKVVEL